MNSTHLILTVMAKDKPGIVQGLSDAIYSHQGSWLESSLSRLGGQFAGIISVSISDDEMDSFKKALADIVADGISVRVHSHDYVEQEQRKSATIYLEANDRCGIVEEISSTLLNKGVNVEHLETECQSASMAGYDLFKAKIVVTLPKRFTIKKLELLLENISDDLMVSVEP